MLKLNKKMSIVIAPVVVTAISIAFVVSCGDEKTSNSSNENYNNTLSNRHDYLVKYKDFFGNIKSVTMNLSHTPTKDEVFNKTYDSAQILDIHII